MPATKRHRLSEAGDTTVFVTISAVKERLHAYDVFDARYSLASPTYLDVVYAKGHLPGARPVYMDQDLSSPHSGTTARHPLPDVDAFVRWCQSRGISGEKPVLAYDDQCGAMGACRLWWMLHSLGVEVYVLAGGYQAYTAAGLPLETGPAVPCANTSSAWPFGRHFAHQVSLSELKPNAILTDARAAVRFSTTARPYGADALPGHIPGAFNLPYTSLMTVVQDGTGRMELRSPDAIRGAILSAIGRDPTTTDGVVDLSDCVFSCGSGISACVNIAAAHHVGLGLPYLYCGSWSEYSGVHRTAIERTTVETYGLLVTIQGEAHPEAPRADPSAHLVTSTPRVPQEELALAASHMHVGETVAACFRSGHTAVITVSPHA